MANCSGTDTTYGMVVFGEEMLGLALDGETLYVDVPGDFRTCAVTDGCATPGTATGTASIDAPFAIRNGRAYWASAFGPALRIQTCTVASCSPTTFANEVHGVSEIEADDSGLYWINATRGTIRHCPLNGCPGGGATYVAPQPRQSGKPHAGRGLRVLHGGHLDLQGRQAIAFVQETARTSACGPRGWRAGCESTMRSASSRLPRGGAGGAGLGLYLVLANVAGLVANLAPGRRTEMVCLLDRGKVSRTRSLHVLAEA